MIDIHSHLLPGVDDGSPTVDVSVPVLRQFAASGVRKVVCTPHLKASRAATAPYERHAEILEVLRRRAPDGLELALGWEIMLDVPGADLRSPRLGLAGSTAVLVEFSHAGAPPAAAEELFRQRMSGVVPVLAHAERYWGTTPERVEEWRGVGTVIQVDSAALAGRGRHQQLAVELLERGLVDVIASDNHGDTRSLATARDWLLDVDAAEQAELLTATNASRLLANEPTLPVPPLEQRRGVLRRLRELFGSRS
ncbi:MAG: tyrosine-protein phosphatase [Gemmatimonadaceae bacterium]